MARTYFSARSAGDVSTTSNTVWSDVVTLTFTPDASTDYWFHWYGDFRVVSTSSDVQVRVYDGTTALDTSNYEARDTSPNEYKTLSGVFKYTSGGSPTSTSFKIQVKAETSGVTVSGRNGQVVAIKAISTDQWVETTANSAPAGSDATIQTLTWTPDQTRDYIMVGSASAGGTSSASDERLRISRGSDSATMASCGITAFKDSTSRLTVMVAAYLAGLTAVSQTYRLKYDNAGGTVTCINNRLLALDVTGENVYSQANTDGTSRSTSTYQDCVTYSPTISNTAEHLIFACGVKNTASSTVSGYVQSLVDGSVVAESVEEHDASNCDFPHCWVWLGSLTSGSRTIKNQAKNESGTVVVNVLQQGYVVWDIQTGAAPSGSGVGAASGAGTVAGTGKSTNRQAGTQAGTGLQTGVGKSYFRATGSMSGLGAVAGVGVAKFKGAGAASGTGTQAATGKSYYRGTGAATGAGTAAGTGQSTARSAGAESGAGTVAGIGKATDRSAGAASGTGTQAGVGRGVNQAAGAASGAGTQAGIGKTTARSPGAASGTGTQAGTGRSDARSTGAAAGVGTQAGIANLGGSAGQASGTGTVTGVGRSTVRATGAASGAGNVIAFGAAKVAATGAASGTGSVAGVRQAVVGGSTSGAMSMINRRRRRVGWR